MVLDQTYDVIIIGGGPAGSAAGALLAEKGWRVLILEKDLYPRYHIGESLLPYCYFPLERIGMIDKLKASRFTRKYSVQFAGTDGRVSQPFYFHEHLDHEAAQTWQVWRSEFDQMLLDNARQKGAVVHQPMMARTLILEEGAVRGVQAKGDDVVPLVFRSPLTIDASGRDGFTMQRKNWRVRDPRLNKIAVWGYFRGGVRDPGIDEGATTVAFLPDRGWFWYIPLADDTISVGITADREYLYRDGKNPEGIFEREIKVNPWIESHLAHAERLGRYWVTGDYSYRSKHCASNGLVLTGDAFAFLDPVFSSGVFLALRSGEMVADAADAALQIGDTSAARFADYGERLCQGIEAMRQLVYAFYDRSFSFGKVLDQHPHLRPDLTDCLIGNLFRDFSALFEAIGQFADLPEPLSHGGPALDSP